MAMVYNYIYKFLNKDGEVIYIGRTNNLKRRFSKHFSTKGHLSLSQYNKVYKILVSQPISKLESNLYEVYYINKINPILNTIFNNHEYSINESLISFKELNFEEYSYSNDIIISYKKLIKEIRIKKLKNNKERYEYNQKLFLQEKEKVKKFLEKESILQNEKQKLWITSSHFKKIPCYLYNNGEEIWLNFNYLHNQLITNKLYCIRERYNSQKLPGNFTAYLYKYDLFKKEDFMQLNSMGRFYRHKEIRQLNKIFKIKGFDTLINIFSDEEFIIEDQNNYKYKIKNVLYEK